MAKSTSTNQWTPDAHGAVAPLFDRLNYFYGQMLGVRDFQIEQQFFREKMKLQNRCLHGHGVVCGLKVTRDPHKTHAPPAGEGGGTTTKPLCLPRLWIETGMALDVEGNELVVRHPHCVDLWDHLDKKGRDDLLAGYPATFYLILQYDELKLEPTRPVLTEGCGGVDACYHGKSRDWVCVKLTSDPPDDDDACEPCCGPRKPEGELLAKLTVHHDPSKPVADVDIDNSVRRPLSTYQATRIASINWVHGGEYGEDDLERLMEQGLRIKFTRPIHEDTIKSGVLDVFVLVGGGAIRGDVKHLQGKVYPAFAVTNKVTKHWGLRFEFGESRWERFSYHDRFLIVLRSAFVLDYCCQPVDGTHVGGWVPYVDEDDKYKPECSKQAHPPLHHCDDLRGTFGSWTSGNRSPGTNFESWIFVKQSKVGHKS